MRLLLTILALLTLAFPGRADFTVTVDDDGNLSEPQNFFDINSHLIPFPDISRAGLGFDPALDALWTAPNALAALAALEVGPTNTLTVGGLTVHGNSFVALPSQIDANVPIFFGDRTNAIFLFEEPELEARARADLGLGGLVMDGYALKLEDTAPDGVFINMNAGALGTIDAGTTNVAMSWSDGDITINVPLIFGTNAAAATLDNLSGAERASWPTNYAVARGAAELINTEDGTTALRYSPESDGWEIDNPEGFVAALEITNGDSGLWSPLLDDTNGVSGVVAEHPLFLDDQPLYLRGELRAGVGDLNHSLEWGYNRHEVDGPLLTGYDQVGVSIGDATDGVDELVATFSRYGPALWLFGFDDTVFRATNAGKSSAWELLLTDEELTSGYPAPVGSMGVAGSMGLSIKYGTNSAAWGYPVLVNSTGAVVHPPEFWSNAPSANLPAWADSTNPAVVVDNLGLLGNYTNSGAVVTRAATLWDIPDGEWGLYHSEKEFYFNGDERRDNFRAALGFSTNLAGLWTATNDASAKAALGFGQVTSSTNVTFIGPPVGPITAWLQTNQMGLAVPLNFVGTSGAQDTNRGITLANLRLGPTNDVGFKSVALDTGDALIFGTNIVISTAAGPDMFFLRLGTNNYFSAQQGVGVIFDVPVSFGEASAATISNLFLTNTLPSGASPQGAVLSADGAGGSAFSTAISAWSDSLTTYVPIAFGDTNAQTQTISNLGLQPDTNTGRAYSYGIVTEDGTSPALVAATNEMGAVLVFAATDFIFHDTNGMRVIDGALWDGPSGEIGLIVEDRTWFGQDDPQYRRSMRDLAGMRNTTNAPTNTVAVEAWIEVIDGLGPGTNLFLPAYR